MGPAEDRQDVVDARGVEGVQQVGLDARAGTWCFARSKPTEKLAIVRALIRFGIEVAAGVDDDVGRGEGVVGIGREVVG